MTVIDESPALAEGSVRATPHIKDQEDRPRQLNSRAVDDVMSFVGSGVSSLAFVWIVYEHILAFSGVLGFLVCWWGVFLLAYVGVSLLSNPVPIVVDRLVSAVVQSAAAVVASALASTIIYIFYQAWPALRHKNFYTQTMKGVAPTDALSRGGVLHAVVGSGYEVGISTAIALPLGIMTAVYMTEVGGRLARLVRTVIEAMTALPDVLAGLFIFAVLINKLRWSHTGLVAGIALAVTMTPTITRSADVVLRVVPNGLREASLALGASKWQTVRRVVLPSARAGLASSLILGVARVAGETAPLLIVSRDETIFNHDPFHNPMTALPLFIYTSIRSGEKVAIERGYGAAALLLALVLVLFVTTRLLSRDKNGSHK